MVLLLGGGEGRISSSEKVIAAFLVNRHGMLVVLSIHLSSYVYAHRQVLFGKMSILHCSVVTAQT